MTNISLGSGKAVHIAHTAITGETLNLPECGGNRASGRYYVTTADVDCKRCLKWQAAEAEAAERTAYYAGLAEQQDNFGSQAVPVAEATPAVEKDPITGWLIVTDRDGTRYAVSGRIAGDLGGMDYVLYRRTDTVGSQRRAYPDMMRGTLQRHIWDARHDYDAARAAVQQPEAVAPADPSRVAGDTEEDALAAALSSAGIVFTPEQLSAAATALTAQQPEADLAARVVAATEVRIVMDSDSVGSAWVNGTEYVIYRGLSSWGVMKTGIRGNSLEGIGKALARHLGITGPVTTTVVPPKD